MLEVQDLHHVSLIVRDAAASQRFFCDVLGMEPAAPPASFQFTVAWVRKGGAEIHLVQADDAVQAPGDNAVQPRPGRDATFARHVCLKINSVEALMETLHANGVPIVAGPRARGDGPTQTYIYDLDGHLIELVCLNSAN